MPPETALPELTAALQQAGISDVTTEWGWPLLRAFWPAGFPALERRSTRRSSQLVTARVAAALAAAGLGVCGP